MKKSINLLSALLTLLLIITFYSCKETSPSEENGDEKSFERGKLQLQLQNNLSFENGIYADTLWTIYMSSIWVATEFNGYKKVNLNWFNFSNYSNSKFGGKVFTFSKTEIAAHPEKWPIQYGAPVNEGNSPKIWGDNIQWSAFANDSTATDPRNANGISGLKLVAYMFNYDDDSLKNIVFIRFDLKNESTKNYLNTLMGVFNDDDLRPSVESVGFDVENQIVYTYVQDSIVINNGHNSSDNTFVGHFVLKSPQNDIPSQQMYSSRKIFKHYPNNYAEATIVTPEQFYWSLEGKDISGQSMINPSTGLETKFAFTGNPITKSGWIDPQPQDRRNMFSIYPIPEIKPQETVTFIIGHIVCHNSSQEKAFNQMKWQVKYLRNNPSLWN